jgi:hypothetical protein
MSDTGAVSCSSSDESSRCSKVGGDLTYATWLCDCSNDSGVRGDWDDGDDDDADEGEDSAKLRSAASSSR